MGWGEKKKAGRVFTLPASGAGQRTDWLRGDTVPLPPLLPGEYQRARGGVNHFFVAVGAAGFFTLKDWYSLQGARPLPRTASRAFGMPAIVSEAAVNW